ncbi:MAG: hypothetical protein K0R15_61 [Clostridiales bacterium]|jgi:preprotein translocase subunit SecY|nr:hypothetical protein [Clostridiales bacterium]
MNCHQDKTNKQGENKHNPMKHMLHMIICCGLPIIIIFSLPFIARFSPSVAGLLGIIAPFICPIMMGGMLFMMFSGKKKSNCCDNTNNEVESNGVSKPLE